MVGVAVEVLHGDDQEDRRSVHSVASTVATTTSLASRLAALNIDFGDKLRDADEDHATDAKEPPSPLHEDYEGEHADDDDDPVDITAVGPVPREGRLSQESSLPPIEQQHREPPLHVCCRLFERRSHPPLPLQRLSMMQVEDFRQHGYVVLDGLISKEAAARIKAEVLKLHHKGQLQLTPASSMGYLSTSSHHLATSSGGSSSLSPPLAQQTASPLAVTANGTSNGCHSAAAAAGGPSRRGSSSSGSGGGTGMPALANGSFISSSCNGNGSTQRPWGERRLQLQLGQPPADTGVLAPLMAALLELQDDLHEFMRLRQRSAAEYALALLPPGGLPVPRHRDALPEDGWGDHHEAAAAAGGGGGGSEPEPGSSAGSSVWGGASSGQAAPAASTAAVVAAGGGPGSSSGLEGLAGAQQPRVTILVFLNSDWEREGGGVLRLWPPLRGHLGPGGQGGGAPSGAAGGRRSPTSSDAGTTFSEASECSSLRTHLLGSTTSSIMAEPSCAAEHDAASLDGYSLADSEVERSGFEWVETEGGEMALDCAPVAGRCVLLLSGAVEHALLPGGGVGADLVYARTLCK